jgi:hypothetical protein
MNRRPARGWMRVDALSATRPDSTYEERVLRHREDLQLVTRLVVEAALAWADRDYGDLEELEAGAALNDAVRQFRRTADHFDEHILDLLFKPSTD